MRIARVGSFVYASFLGFSLARCGGESRSSGGSGNVDAFVGTWACDSKSSIQVTTPTGRPAQTLETSFTFSVTRTGDSTVTAGDAEDPSCSDQLIVSGSKASIKSPYECTQDDGTMLKVTAESITVSGQNLSGTRTSSVSATAANGDPITGNGTTTIECTRLSEPPDGGSEGQAGTGGRTGGGNATGSDAGTGANSCANAAACVDCCANLYPTGSDVLTRLLLDCTCMQCSTECAASLCSENSTTPADGDPCERCARQALSSVGNCKQTAATACHDDVDCAVLASCLATCSSGSPI